MEDSFNHNPSEPYAVIDHLSDYHRFARAVYDSLEPLAGLPSMVLRLSLHLRLARLREIVSGASRTSRCRVIQDIMNEVNLRLYSMPEVLRGTRR
ncbi:hypothetical protein BJX76DRAFT_320823 [Aspergillus varians]